ncbi:MAG: hypothetical protein M3357_02275 [Actinomycetota bacterium]|nr:hypothetical protein [Actinomycetota bacterium]
MRQPATAAQATPDGAAKLCLVTRVLVLAVAFVLAPWGTPPVVRYVDAHVDVPYVRDCQGLFTHPDECVTAAGARG